MKVNQAAEFLRLSNTTVRFWIKRGWITSVDVEGIQCVDVDKVQNWMSPEGYMTVYRAGHLVGYHPKSVLRLARMGYIQSTKRGRLLVEIAGLKAYISARNEKQTRDRPTYSRACQWVRDNREIIQQTSRTDAWYRCRAELGNVGITIFRRACIETMGVRRITIAASVIRWLKRHPWNLHVTNKEAYAQYQNDGGVGCYYQFREVLTKYKQQVIVTNETQPDGNRAALQTNR